MSKKKLKIKFTLDYYVSWFFCIVAVLFYLIDSLFLSGKLNQTILLSPTNGRGNLPFNFAEAESIFRLFLYTFGYGQIESLFYSLIIILLLGAKMEEYYGSLVIGIMVFVAVLFSGVMTASFYEKSISGMSPILFMLLFLELYINLSKKKISLVNIFSIVFLLSLELFSKESVDFVGMAIKFAGGLCGSLFALLASPRGRANSKKERAIAELDASSPRFKKEKTIRIKSRNKKTPEPPTSREKSNSDSNQETIIGTLEF